MSEKNLSYLNANYNDFRNGLIEKSRKYYSDIFDSWNDASIGAWWVDIIADISDTLRYNIDRVYQETDIDSASSKQSLMQIARTNGLKISGPKCAIVEVELTCKIPMNRSNTQNDDGNQSLGDTSYCPYIKRGTLFSTGSQTFELTDDVDFNVGFDNNGISNRQIIPNRDGNGNITSYTYKKLALARSGISRIYKHVVTSNEIEPFMSITLQDTNVTNIESIILKEGTTLANDPAIAEFYVDKESYLDKTGKPVQRYFEVDNLIDQYRFGYVVNEGDDGYYDPVWHVVDEFEITDEYGDPVLDGNGNPLVEPVRLAMQGKWKRLKNKFTTEYTDNNKMKVTFGAGIRNQYGVIPSTASEFTKYMMSRMEANDYMGVLPEAGTTMYVLYHVGGGEESNIGANTLTTITYLNMDIEGNCNDPNDGKKKMSVRNTLTVNNPTPSYGGKDSPNADEIRNIIKYNAVAQNRCVTLKDYYAKIAQIHPKYGTPFRYNVVEENNKVVIYTLGLDYQGDLMTMLSETVGNNIKEYLSMYKCINDFVEIRSGKVINVGFDVNVYIDKAYDKSEVVKRIIELIQDYMDIRRHFMGEDIFLGDLEKEIAKLDGVVNLVSLRCVNKTGEGYSNEVINQTTVDQNICTNIERAESLGYDTSELEVDLLASDKTLYSSIDTMFEIKYPSRDIHCRTKIR